MEIWLVSPRGRRGLVTGTTAAMTWAPLFLQKQNINKNSIIFILGLSETLCLKLSPKLIKPSSNPNNLYCPSIHPFV